MHITNENYYSVEANKEYFSVSQFKTFLDCEARAMAEINGQFEQEKTTSLLVGSYVDAHFSGTLDFFKAKNPEIFLKNGVDLKSDYKQANEIIERIERDNLFSQVLSGENQVPLTGEIEGIPFKILIDSYIEGKAIVDLKVVRDFEPVWKGGKKLDFVAAWGYDLQGAVYQAIEGNGLPFYLACATKEKVTDIKLIQISQERLDYGLWIIKDNIKRFDAIKKGLEQPHRCEQCDYCKLTKVLKEAEVWELNSIK